MNIAIITMISLNVLRAEQLNNKIKEIDPYVKRELLPVF